MTWKTRIVSAALTLAALASLAIASGAFHKGHAGLVDGWY